MTVKFFANVNIEKEEDLLTLVQEYKRCVFANEEEKAQAIEEMDDMIQDFNQDLENIAISKYAKSETLIADLIPQITLTERENANSNTRKNKVFNAIAYPQFFIIENEGTRTIKKRIVPVTIRKIMEYYANSLAFGHNDGKVTKQDREKARETVLTHEIDKALTLFMYGAYAYENVTETVKGYSKIARLTEEEKAIFIEGKPSKSRSEKQLNEVAKMLQLDVKFKKAHALSLYKRCYTLDRKGQATVADTADVLQDFILYARYAKNDIELPEVKDKAGLFKEVVVADENILSFR